MTKANTQTYPHGCPKCQQFNAYAEIHAEDDWAWQDWTCQSCNFRWRENYEFSYWEELTE